MKLIQSLDTTGARAAETFMHAGARYLVIPQLAADVPGQPALMTAGNSDIHTEVLRWEDGCFVHDRTLPVPGGEDAQHFRIGDREFLALASLRTGSGPYDLNALSTIYELRGGEFTVFQTFPTFAAKQWRHWSIGARHFLGLALGVGPEGKPRHPHRSTIYEWNGQRFDPFQEVPSSWGYNWAHAAVDGQHLVAHADHLAPSLILRWDGARFEPWQELEGKSGRAICFFSARGQHWLAFACMLGETWLYRHDGERYVRHQCISGPGGRELVWDPVAQQLLVVNFIQGSREAPRPLLQSWFHRFEGSRLVPAEAVASCGATDASIFSESGSRYLVVSNSLNEQVRFRVASQVYLLDGAGA